MPQAFVVRDSSAMLAPSWDHYGATISQMRTVSIEQIPRVIMVQEPWFPWALELPVQASVPMRFGLLVAPTLPDPIFDAEPSALLVDNFRGNGWPVFKANRG